MFTCNNEMTLTWYHHLTYHIDDICQWMNPYIRGNGDAFLSTNNGAFSIDGFELTAHKYFSWIINGRGRSSQGRENVPLYV